MDDPLKTTLILLALCCLVPVVSIRSSTTKNTVWWAAILLSIFFVVSGLSLGWTNAVKITAAIILCLALAWRWLEHWAQRAMFKALRKHDEGNGY